MVADFVYLASGSPRRRELLMQIGVPFRVLAAFVDESVRPGETASAYVARLAVAKAAAGRKASGAAPQPILAADTTVALDGEILGKPRDRDDGVRMLLALAGRTHEVFTAVAVAGVTTRERADKAVAKAGVTLREPGSREAGVTLREPGSREAGVTLRESASREAGLTLREPGNEMVTVPPAPPGIECRLSRSEVTFRAIAASEAQAYWDTGEPHDKAGGYAVQGLAAVFITQLAGSYSGVMGLPLYETAALLAAAGVPRWR